MSEIQPVSDEDYQEVMRRQDLLCAKLNEVDLPQDDLSCTAIVMVMVSALQSYGVKEDHILHIVQGALRR